MHLDDILREHWLQRGRTQAQFARSVAAIHNAQHPECEVLPPAANTISTWFRGVSVPSPQKLKLVAIVLGMDPGSVEERALLTSTASIPRK